MKYEYPIKKILVPTDYSVQANNAVYLACDIAKNLNAQVTLLTAL